MLVLDGCATIMLDGVDLLLYVRAGTSFGSIKRLGVTGVLASSGEADCLGHWSLPRGAGDCVSGAGDSQL